MYLLLCDTWCRKFVCTFHSTVLDRKGQIWSSYNGSRSGKKEEKLSGIYFISGTNSQTITQPYNVYIF